MMSSPLHRGVWWHALLEAYHSGQDWMAIHKKYCHEFNKLFDEEKDHYGDLPREIERIMRSYIWHYAEDPWEYLEVEKTLEAEMPDGTLYRGKVDALIRNQFGLWLVDHKSHKTLPNHDFRVLDPQSSSYLWAAWQNGLEVRGFIWNYVRWKAPSIPKLLVSGKAISKAACDTDYVTYVSALKKYKSENEAFKITPEYKAKADALKRERYQFGRIQTSTFFNRVVMEKTPEQVERAMKENFHTARLMNSYGFDEEHRDEVQRAVSRNCAFDCSYRDVCTTELIGGNVRNIIRNGYTVGDPNDYYEDRAGEVRT